MATSDQLKAERSRYYVFREQVNTLATKTLESYNQYYSVHNKIKEAYLVDGESGDKGVIKKSYEQVKQNYDLLINTTLPAINNKIDSLSAQIRAAEQKEEEEELAKQKANQLLERI